MKITDAEILAGSDPIVVIYHGAECLDGFGSAFAAWTYFSDHQMLDRVYFIAANHGDAIPQEVQNAVVYLLDYSYKKAQMAELCSVAKQVIVLDHHVTAQTDCSGLDREYPNLSLNFDLTRSGAVIAWEYFHDIPVPMLLQHVQDRDLWHWAFADSGPVTVALMARPYDFEVWSDYARKPIELQELAKEGVIINRYRRKQIEYFKTRAVMGNIAGYDVPVVNCPNSIASELLSELAQGHPFAAGYSDKGTKRGWSLRATEDGVNVAEIAVELGGGGHPRAAGFATQLPEQLLMI
ncbi:MAG: DHHA1 domain-containing protein [Pseudomonadales bacterium]|nr:DHHA1 domain-containing protein [Pseudomonadales bacterium]